MVQLFTKEEIEELNRLKLNFKSTGVSLKGISFENTPFLCSRIEKSNDVIKEFELITDYLLDINFPDEEEIDPLSDKLSNLAKASIELSDELVVRGKRLTGNLISKVKKGVTQAKNADFSGELNKIQDSLESVKGAVKDLVNLTSRYGLKEDDVITVFDFDYSSFKITGNDLVLMPILKNEYPDPEELILRIENIDPRTNVLTDLRETLFNNQDSLENRHQQEQFKRAILGEIPFELK